MNRSILASLILLFPSFLLGADSPSGTQRLLLKFKDSVGLVDYFKSDDIPEAAAQSIRNVDFVRNSVLTSRRGVESGFFTFQVDIFADPNKINPHFIDVYVSTNFATTYFFTRVESRMQYHTYPLAASQANGDFSLMGCGNVNGIQIDGTNFDFNNSYYVVREGLSACKFTNKISSDPTLNVTVSSGVPPGKYATVHLNRLIVSGSTIPSRVYFSEEDAPDSFSAENFFDIIGIRSGDEVRGIGKTLLGLMPIYTRDTTNVLSGTEFPTNGSGGNVSVRTVSDTIGTVHHNTIRNIGNKQYFFSSGHNGNVPGIYVFNGVSVSEITKSVRNLFLTVDVTTRIVPNAFTYKENYCLNVATKSSGFLNLMICVDPTGRVTVNDNPNQILSVGYAIPFRSDIIFVNGAIRGNETAPINNVILRWDSGFTDNTSSTTGANIAVPVPVRYKSKDFDFGESERPKLYERTYVSYENVKSTFSLKLNFDFGVNVSSWVIFSTTNYQNNSAIQTIVYSSSVIVSKLLLPTTRFKTVNFEVSFSSYNSLNYLDTRATPQPLE